MDYNYKSTGRPTEGDLPPNFVFWSHYSDVENTPLYPFGYGLSYTTFGYKKLKLNKSSYSLNEDVIVSVEVTNTGELKGKEVVQLYIRDLVASVTRPVRELKGFELVELEKGETKKVSFTLNKETLGFYDNKGNVVLEPGDFEVFVGGSSHADLKKSFELK